MKNYCKLYIDSRFIRGAIKGLGSASTVRIFRALVCKVESGQDPVWLSEDERRVFDLLWEKHEESKMALKASRGT